MCGICGKLCEEWLCTNCTKRISKYENTKLINIINNNTYYDKLLYIFKYEKLIRKLILQYKFFNKSYLNYTFEKIILNNKNICRLLKLYDIIIPVPMYKFKKKIRGYNQTELIAKSISKELNIHFDPNYIIKIVNTKMQSKLGKEERKNNIRNAFCFNKNIDINKKKIILFDDIYTTGATADEISKLLKKNRC